MPDFHGLPTRSLSNPYLRVEFLTRAGPRIVRLFLSGSSQNLLAETPDIGWPTPYGDYRLYGGHRLWCAPEAFPGSCIPDNTGLLVKEIEDGVRLCQPAESITGVLKSIDIHLRPDRPALTLRHRLKNDGLGTIECAPWAITQLPLGGIVILPQPAGGPDVDRLRPDRHLALWPYTRWDDPRLHIHEASILIEASPRSDACKIGYWNRRGWIGYLRDGILFRKRFQPLAAVRYPDGGCNVEVYCSPRYVEIETLSPLGPLEPGQFVTHDEIWELGTRLAAPAALDDAQTLADLAEGELQ